MHSNARDLPSIDFYFAAHFAAAIFEASDIINEAIFVFEVAPYTLKSTFF